jgi:hypothetical protein
LRQTLAPELSDDEVEVDAVFVNQLLPYPGQLISDGTNRITRVYQIYAKSWDVRMLHRGAKYSDLTASFDIKGRLVLLYIRQPRNDANLAPSSPQDILPSATQWASELFNVDVSRIQPIEMHPALSDRNGIVSTKIPIVFPYSKEAPFVGWRLPGILGTQQYIVISANHGRLLAAANALNDSLDWPLPPTPAARFLELEQSSDSFRAIFIGGDLAGLVALLAIILWLQRRLYQQTAAAMLIISVIGALALSYFVCDLWLQFAHAGSLATTLTVLAAFFVFLLLIYSILSTSQSYLLRTLPTAVMTFLNLLRQPFKEQSVGFSIVRGLALGSSFLAVHTVALWLLSHAKLGAPSAMWLFPIERNQDVLSGVCSGVLATIVSGWLLLAFPVSLLKRTGLKVGTQFALIAMLWGVSAATLPGASVNPVWSLYIFAGLQGLFFAFVFLRWDFLTCLTAIFTVEAWLVCYPTYRIFANVDGLYYACGLLPWVALSTLGVLIALGPKIHAGWQRLKVIFN